MSTINLPMAPERGAEKAVASLVDTLIEQISALAVPDRRTEPRLPLAMPIRCREWDALHGQYDEEFVAVTRHISKHGIALLHTANVTSSFLHLELTIGSSDRLEMVLEVLRTRSVGPLWEVAGRFMFF